MKVFLDTNVVLDFLLARHPHALEATAVWTLSEQGRIQGLVSALSIANVYYIVRKFQGRSAARKSVQEIRDVFAIAGCTERTVAEAADDDWDDFEDALQNFSAVHAKAECIITRNEDHFAKSQLPVFSPTTFLAVHPFRINR